MGIAKRKISAVINKSLILGFGILLVSSLGAAAQTLTSVNVTTAPFLDGTPEAIWDQANAISVNVSGGANNFSTTVTLKSIYTDDSVYFLAQWADPTQSLRFEPWVKQQNGSWMRLIDPNDKGGDDNKFYEDKFAQIWNMNITDFKTGGCSVACHAGESGKPYGNMYTANQGETGDLWQMKMVRTNSTGYVDDQLINSTRFNATNAPRAGIFGDPGVVPYLANINNSKAGPESTSITQPAQISKNYWIFEDGGMFPFNDTAFNHTYVAGDEIASVIVRPPHEDRSDIQGRAVYKDGTWTLEYGRKLVTGSQNDVQFSDLKKEYSFGTAVFDNSQVRHGFQNGSDKLAFALPAANTQAGHADVKINTTNTSLVDKLTNNRLRIDYSNFNPGDEYNISIKRTNDSSVVYTATGPLVGKDKQIVPIRWIPGDMGNYLVEAAGNTTVNGTNATINDSKVVKRNLTSIGLELKADNLTSPLSVISPGDGTGRLFIIDQVGTIRILTSDGKLQDKPFLNISDKIVKLDPAYDERGLLGLAFHPKFKDNGRFFVYYSAPLRQGAPQNFDHTNYVAEFNVSANDSNVADPNSERILLVNDHPYANHNAGQITFGPDGYLYIPIGDGGYANDVGIGHISPGGNAQNLTTIMGKILRIDVDNGTPYGIPADNPFAGGGGLPEIFAYGLRNPYRIAFDVGGNHSLFAQDAGQNDWEEADIITKGGNYGWNIKEGTHCFNPDDPYVSPQNCSGTGARGEPLIDPVVEFRNANQPGGLALVIVGGLVYRGDALPELNGSYIFGGASTSVIKADGELLIARPPSPGEKMWQTDELWVATNENGRLNAVVKSFGQDDKNELYILASEKLGPTGNTGKVYKIVPPAQVPNVTATPGATATITPSATPGMTATIMPTTTILPTGTPATTPAY